MRKVLFLAYITLAVLGCGGDDDMPCIECLEGYTGSYGLLTYQGKTYKTVQIGNQTWMAENLSYDVDGSKCYNNDPANCDKYGRLYDWSTAMALPFFCNSSTCSGQVSTKHRGICPSGWHIPSDADWDALMTAVGGWSTAAMYLKATSGWDSYNVASGNGYDTYGFSALPGGDGYFDDDFNSVGDSGHWWRTSEINDYSTYTLYINNAHKYPQLITFTKSHLCSVRCVQD